MNKNILLIDDDASISEVLQIFFSDQGFRVISYIDGSNVEVKIKEASPDIILIDYLLPGKTGVQTVREIRKKLTYKDLPIIMITANKIYRKEAEKAGVNEFMEKPFDLYVLLNTVNRYVKTAN